MYTVDELLVQQLRWLRSRRNDPGSLFHCDKEICCDVAFKEVFFPAIVKSLTNWHKSKSDLSRFHFSCWCPTKPFTEFERRCRDYTFEPQVRRDKIEFKIPACYVPFHVLGGWPDNTVPFTESAHPWFATTWKMQQEVVLPAVQYNSTTQRLTYIRLVQGDVVITWNRAKQRLDVEGHYCDAHSSDGFMTREWSAVKGDLAACHEVVLNVAMNLADREDCGRVRSDNLNAVADSDSDSESEALAVC